MRSFKIGDLVQIKEIGYPHSFGITPTSLIFMIENCYQGRDGTRCCLSPHNQLTRDEIHTWHGSGRNGHHNTLMGNLTAYNDPAIIRINEELFTL